MGAYATMNPLAAGEITGSGTAGQIAVWSTSSTLGVPTIPFTSLSTGFIIGTYDPGSPPTASILSLSSTSMAFLPPSMTAAQMNAIAGVSGFPDTGSMIYQSDSNLYFFYNGSSWGSLAPSASPTFTGTVTSNADIKIGAAGKGLYIKEGTNATMGSVSVSINGTSNTDTVISTTKVTANSRIFLTVNSCSNDVILQITTHVKSRVAGTSFTIRTMSGDGVTATLTISWLIIEPA